MRSRASLSALGVVLGLAVTVSATVALSARAAKAKAAARKPASAAKQVASAASHPVYLRIKTPTGTTVYVKFQGAQMRMATTVAGLKAATPVKGVSPRGEQGRVTFRETTLPVPSDALPPHWTQIKASFWLYTPSVVRGPREPMIYCSGELTPLYADEQGAVWSYPFRMGGRAEPKPDGQFNLVQVPDPAKISLSVTAQSRGMDFQFAIRANVAGQDLADVLKDGKPADVVQVTVLDDQGTEVSAKQGSLASFGFG